jgi:hypothetical protein
LNSASRVGIHFIILGILFNSLAMIITNINRLFLILCTGLFLLNFLTHGPGRGVSLIPAEDWQFALIKLLSLVCFLVGSILFSRNALTAFILLAAGLLARSILELKYSVGKLWFTDSGWNNHAETPMVIAFYIASFVLPALLTIDCFRNMRLKLRIQKAEKAAIDYK